MYLQKCKKILRKNPQEKFSGKIEKIELLIIDNIEKIEYFCKNVMYRDPLPFSVLYTSSLEVGIKAVKTA